MILQLDFSNDTPIYLQIRNQIVMGIADGRLVPGEKLPTIRALADESGINMMTVNKAYQLLKSEGYITADRRSGATISGVTTTTKGISDKSKADLKVIIAEARLGNLSKEEFLEMCNLFYEEMEE